MKLIGSTTSPYVRKISVILLEKKLPYEFVAELPWTPETRVPDYNPLGKVPALVADDGKVWFDSPVIVGYLETLNTAPAMLPPEGLARMEVRQTEALAAGIIDAGVAVLLENKRPAERQDADWIARQNGKIARSLPILAAQAAGKQWLHGNAMSVADIAVCCLLGWLDFRRPDIDWRKDHPALATYAAPIMARPSFVATVPKA